MQNSLFKITFLFITTELYDMLTKNILVKEIPYVAVCFQFTHQFIHFSEKDFIYQSLHISKNINCNCIKHCIFLF